MKNICAVIALCACSGVVMADYIVDTMTGGGFSQTYVGTNNQNRFDTPTNSTVPTDWGYRDSYFQTYQDAGASITSTMSVGSGQINLSWNISAAPSTMAFVGTGLRYYFGGADLGSMTTFSVDGFGTLNGSYSTSDITVILVDTSNRSSIWWLQFNPPGAFNGFDVDLTSAPGFVMPGFDLHSLANLEFRFGLFGQGGSTADGSITLTSIAFTPTPGAAALLGLGGLVAGRRRR